MRKTGRVLPDRNPRSQWPLNKIFSFESVLCLSAFFTPS